MNVSTCTRCGAPIGLVTYLSYADGNAQEAQRWITLADGNSSPYCPIRGFPVHEPGGQQ